MRYPDVVRAVEAALGRPLPGAPAHALMAPRPRREWPAGVDRASIRHAAGLLLVYDVDDRAHVALTVRSARVRHGGQVSLPGGVVEAGESLEQTALRESTEEIGLDPTGVRILGALTALDIPVSGFRLHPIVAALDRKPILQPSDAEVGRILDVPVAALLDRSRIEWRTMERGTLIVDAPGFTVDNALIWGATAMVLAEFLVLLGWTGPARSDS